MPNSVTIISPVSGETLYLPGTQKVVVSFDYENGESGTVYACGSCTAGLPSGGGFHLGTYSVAEPYGEAEAVLGDHSGTHTNVTLSGLLMSGQNTGTNYAQFSVNNIKITETAPPMGFDPDKHPLPGEENPLLLRLSESGLTDDRRKRYASDVDGKWRPYDPYTDGPKRNIRYDHRNDLELYVLIPNRNHRINGYIMAEVSARNKKTDLSKVYSVTEKVVISDEDTCQCKVVIPKKVFKGGARKVRQVVLTLLDAEDGDFVATISFPLAPQ